MNHGMIIVRSKELDWYCSYTAGSSKRALGSECPVLLYINCDLPIAVKSDFKVLVFKRIFMPVWKSNSDSSLRQHQANHTLIKENVIILQ